MSDHLYHTIEEKSSLFKLLSNWLTAYRARTEAWRGSGEGAPANPDIALIKEELSIVHGIIFDLTGKVQQLMASQEERLQAVQGQLSSIADGINTLQQQLADLKANNPALDDEISNIEATVKAIGEDLNPPAPAPVEG